MDSSKIVLMVVTHKPYKYPEAYEYLPVQVGRALSKQDLGIQGDNTGDNISFLNRSFCELTGQYWLWKNFDADIYGLVHYRRYFLASASSSLSLNGECIATGQELIDILINYDLILPKKRHYIIDTVFTHYEHSHYLSDLQALENVIEKIYPDYLTAFKKVLSMRSLSLFNMFVMKKDMFNAYSSWLFQILFEVEKIIPYQKYDSFQGRVFGFLGERLLNVWVEKNRIHLKVKYLSVVNIEGEKKFKKALNMIKRKLKFS